MDWYLYPAVIAAGFVAGFINTLAGSGSLVTLPLLIFIGLPATVANGTNRVAILLQNVVAVRGFRREKMLSLKQGLWLAAPAVAGAFVGAQIAVGLDEAIMRRTIGVLMVVMLAAGGIVDGRGLVASLALGAVGVWTGTVWLTAHESPLVDFLKDKVARFKHPKSIRLIDDLPLTATMKVKKAELKEAYGGTQN